MLENYQIKPVYTSQCIELSNSVTKVANTRYGTMMNPFVFVPLGNLGNDPETVVCFIQNAILMPGSEIPMGVINRVGNNDTVPSDTKIGYVICPIHFDEKDFSAYEMFMQNKDTLIELQEQMWAKENQNPALESESQVEPKTEE